MVGQFFESQSFAPEMVNNQVFFSNTYCNFSFPKHFHDEFLIQIIKEGTNSFYCDGGTHNARWGDVVLINPGEVHNGNSRQNEKLNYNVFYIAPRTLDEVLGNGDRFLARSFRFEKNLVRDEVLFSRIDKFFTALQTKDYDEIQLHENYLDILIYIAARYTLVRQSKIEFGSYHASTIKDLKEYIEENLANKLLLEDLSRIGAISPFHLLRVFTKDTGLTLHQFILVRRIERSKEMLKKKTTISDVSYSLGFSDQSHFTRSFKKMIGLTPKQYQTLFKSN